MFRHFLFIVLLAGRSLADEASDFEAALRALRSKNSLTFGAACSYREEKRREDLGRALVNFDLSAMPATTQRLRVFNEAAGKLCDELRLLECLPNGTCGCANKVIGGLEVVSSKEGRNCRVARGSACLPPSGQAGSFELRCQARYSCRLQRERTSCTNDVLVQEVMGTMDRGQKLLDPTSLVRVIQEKQREGVCRCW